MVAFHYPPMWGSSGIQRTLRFSRYLPDHGWRPIVLTAHPRAYPNTHSDSLGDIPPSVLVERAFALDTARHLCLNGRYLKALALPDRWISWVLGAVPKGLALIRLHRPAVLWSTYPIASAHLVGYCLHRLTGIPWVADFRDPMTEGEPGISRCFPEDPTLWKMRRRIERLTVAHCTRAVFVSPGAREIYANRYASLPSSKWEIIANGYDEEAFLAAKRLAVPARPANAPLLFIHSGVLYPMEGDRNPIAFFKALRELKSTGEVSSQTVHILLRASGNEEVFQKTIDALEINDLVSLAPALPYTEALAEMLHADGLLVFQGPISNPNIPAKLYEYMRARRPIFALVDSAGDTAGVLRQIGVGILVPLDDPRQIGEGFLRFLEQVRNGTAARASDAAVKAHSREARTVELAKIFNDLGS